MANRNDFDDFFGDDEETPVVDTRADGRLYRVPLARIAPNLVNPRQDFGTEDQLIDLGKSLARRQNQPCPVVSRNAYLKLWPEHAERIKDVDYVLVSGERRYRAATAVGLAALNCVANDDFATGRKTFMEAVVSENVDRQNFDAVEEAYAVQALVAEFGSNRAVAQHFERADGWVTQRLLLTHLATEVQTLVRKKTIPLEVARTLGKLARDNDWSARDQLEWWDSEQERREAASAARAAARRAGRQKPVAETPAAAAAPVAPTEPGDLRPSFTAVKHQPLDDHGASPRPQRSVPQPPSGATLPAQDPPSLRPSPPRKQEQPEQIPEPRSAVHAVQPEDRHPKPFPYHDGVFAGQLLIHKMDSEQLDKLYEILTANREKSTTSAG